MQNNDQLNAIILKVQEIFREVLDDSEIVLKYETTSADIPEWDSLNHIALVVDIEKKFKIKFTAHEIQTYKNVGDMCVDIVKKISDNVF